MWACSDRTLIHGSPMRDREDPRTRGSPLGAVAGRDSPHLDERLLCDLLGDRPIPDDAQRHAEDRACDRVVQVLEGPLVAARTRDQIA